jgi:hypothetical protein
VGDELLHLGRNFELLHDVDAAVETKVVADGAADRFGQLDVLERGAGTLRHAG